MRKKKCFFITPISDEGSEIRKSVDGIINEVISPILKKLNYELYVAHRCNMTGSINKEIILELYQADLVIANLKTLNPNVMYELGISHSFRKPTITIMEEVGERLPFDIIDQRTIFYEDSCYGMTQLKTNLEKSIENIEETKRISNPVCDAIDLLNVENMIEENNERVRNELITLNNLLNKHFNLDMDPDEIPSDEEYDSYNRNLDLDYLINDDIR